MGNSTMTERICAMNLRTSTYYDPYIAQEIAKAEVRCHEAETKAQIKIVAEKMRGEVLADIAARKELQKTKVHVTLGQNVVVSRERFGDDLTDVAPFAVKGCETLVCLKKNRNRLLHVHVITDRADKSIFFCYEKMEERYINKKFNAAGIAFGFSHEKETRMRKMLLMELINLAPVCFLPEKHGWYEREGVIGFAFPEMQIWEEFERYV